MEKKEEIDNNNLRLKEYEKQCSGSKYNLTLNNIKYTNSTRIGNYIYYAPCIGKGSFSKVFIGHCIHDNLDELNGTDNLPESALRVGSAKLSDNLPDNTSTELTRGKLVAIKRINTSSIKKMSLGRLKSEISLLKDLNHKNIVKFYEAFTDIANNIYIVTEYCNAGNLEIFTKTHRLNESEIKKYMMQIREGLMYLILNNVLHRDIKPQNLLLHKEGDETIVKIADFGFAKHFDNLDEESLTNTLCGTPMYLAPEVVKHKKYTVVSDLWSIGVILYQLFYHTTPFKRPKNIVELIKNIDTMRLKFGKIASASGGLTSISQDASFLIEQLLETEPIRRINWDNFFTHDWFLEKAKHITSASDNRSVTQSIQLPRRLQDIDTSSDEEDEETSAIGKGIPINAPEKSFFGQTSRLFSEPNIVNDYIQFSPSSVPTEKTVISRTSSSSWTDSPVLKYITSSLTKITENLSLGGK